MSSALSSELRERGGRTRLQKSDSRHKPPTTLLLPICASHSRFQLIIRDLGTCRKVPNCALSRRQHGFESRWGHKIKPSLTRPDTTASRSASPWIHRQGRARDAGAPASAAFGSAPDQQTLLGQRGGCECRRTCAVASLDLVLDGKALWRIAKDYRRVGDSKESAIRLMDAGRRQKLAIAGDFPTIHLSSTTGRKETQEFLSRIQICICQAFYCRGETIEPPQPLISWRARHRQPRAGNTNEVLHAHV